MFSFVLPAALLLAELAHGDQHRHLHHRREMILSVAEDLFKPISHDKPILIPTRDDHPQRPVGIQAGSDAPIQTNKFYGNFIAGTQNNATWTYPYSVWWSNDTANHGYGLSVSHADREDFVYGAGDPAQSFEEPLFRQSIALSAYELQKGTVLTTDTLKAFSVNVNLAPAQGAKPLLTFPLVQGMAFVTGVYNNASVLIQSKEQFFNLTEIGPVSSTQEGTSPVHGWRVQAGDGSMWLIYLSPTGRSQRPNLMVTDRGTITGPSGFSGTVQVAKCPDLLVGLDVFNRAAGAYPVGATISATVSGKKGTYTLAWTKSGVRDSPLLMFALPHHVRSFDETTRQALTPVTLAAATKGVATAVSAEAFIMVEDNLPTDISFDPWSPTLGSVGSKNASGGTISDEAKAAVVEAARIELARDVSALTNLASKYFSGIAFSVYARSLYAVHEIAGNASFTDESLRKLKAAFDVYVKNQEQNPLLYDTVWKGIVSSGSYGNGDSSNDFGNTYYNDHHFHYSYYVYTAAVIAHFDPSWLTANDGNNKVWVNNLIRDWANPSTEDPFFPFYRAYDWFHGHSWARGVLEAQDGKDQESSSEDAFSTYAIKMWARVTGDALTEARANLQLAVTARSLQSYYLLATDNDVQPAQYVPNRVSGILWDRKVNHTTYFGDVTAYIQGIHMLPIVPCSAYIRPAAFVRQEWDQYFAGNKSGQLTDGGYASHVYVNLAIADKPGAVESYEFMKGLTPSSPYLDGVSLAWNLAYTAALGGSLGSTSRSNSTAIQTVLYPVNREKSSMRV
ncbi:putative endo-1,3(4)-beta-glucanase [Colletotrichum tanaceti]|uniref:glucan endo-1,3-beta-D-glucosidase n=1 Tax=Colletotrichum tanaceti TaxID=1306861 RepID=A0A4U6XQM8_9PEZI|nr:putative endo-1,3(4)-beta-glucanase [Colletotrichum tanaceti]TKW58088.1 putative endo-1,3(4)-beta-glucanase [Colletotrichum tanaceti]